MLPALDEGGVERGTLEVAAALAERGHRALVISAGGRLVTALEAAGATHINMPIGVKSPWTLRLIPRLRRLLEEEAVDIVHARSRLPAWIAHLALGRMPAGSRPRFVTTVHGLYSVSAYSAVMTRGEVVIAVSEAVRRYLLDNYPKLDPSRIVVIHRGVDESVFNPRFSISEAWLERFRDEFPETRGRFLVTIAGRLSRLKGLEDFLDLIDGLVRRNVPAHGLVLGDDKGRRRRYADGLKRAIAERALPVSFLGTRRDVREIFAVSGVVVSLSRKPESFGRTMLEALSLGTPAVGYGHGGVGEILESIFPQGAVSPGNISAAVDAVERISREQLRVTENNSFLLSRMLDATLGLYEDLAK